MTSDTRIALITGGSRGLGRNTAEHLLRKGADVILTYRTGAAEAAEVSEYARSLNRRAVALPLDTGDTAGFPSFRTCVSDVLHREWNRECFDFLVNNAGIGLRKPFAEVTEAEFDLLQSVHLKGVFFLTQTLLPLIADGGRIVNVTSRLAQSVKAGNSVYGPMKAAVESLTLYLAQELGPRGITVNAVAPGATETDFGGGSIRDNPEINAAVAASTALGRAGLPDDIGGAICDLLMGDFGWMTGQRIELSGGQRG